MATINETARVRRYKQLTFFVLGLCSLMDLGLWWIGPLRIEDHEMVRTSVTATVLTGLLALLLVGLRSAVLEKVELPLTRQLLQWLPEAAQVLFVFIWTPTAITIGHYVGMPYSLPLADAWLAAPEQWIGLPHPTSYDWFASLGVIGWFDLIYESLGTQLVLVAAIHILFYRRLFQIWQYAGCVALAGVTSVPALWLFPALGPTEYYKGQYVVTPRSPPWVDAIPELKQSVMNTDVGLIGLLSCPSFHTVFALYLMRAWLGTPKPIVMVAIVLNALVVISTIPTGLHYLSDTTGGIVWAVVFALIGDYWSKRPFAESEAV